MWLDLTESVLRLASVGWREMYCLKTDKSKPVQPLLCTKFLQTKNMNQNCTHISESENVHLSIPWMIKITKQWTSLLWPVLIKYEYYYYNDAVISCKGFFHPVWNTQYWLFCILKCIAFLVNCTLGKSCRCGKHCVNFCILKRILKKTKCTVHTGQGKTKTGP